jgi:hypothetical protein
MSVFEGIHEQVGTAANAVLEQYAEALMHVVASSTYPSGLAIRTDDELLAITKNLDEVLASMLRGQSALYLSGMTRIAEGIGHQMLDAYGVFGKSSVGRLQAATDAFVREGQTVGSEGFRQWYGRFQEVGTSLRDQMQREIVRAKLTGMSQRELANAFIDLPGFDFANLPSIGERGMRIFTRGGRVGMSEALKNRAMMIARTELQAVTNDMHITWTKNAGFEKYINVNPMDERTTPGCAEASQQPAMTLEEWRRWMGSDGQGGIPPRKPNCRSSLFALPNQALLTADELAASGQHFQ